LRFYRGEIRTGSAMHLLCRFPFLLQHLSPSSAFCTKELISQLPLSGANPTAMDVPSRLLRKRQQKPLMQRPPRWSLHPLADPDVLDFACDWDASAATSHPSLVAGSALAWPRGDTGQAPSCRLCVLIRQ